MSKIDELLKNEKVEWKKLGEVCEIKTGKLNANAKVENGKYLFFTTAQEISYINEYAFEGESLLVAGNANIGDVKYYSGKFNAYQRVYVLQKFNKINAVFLMYFMKKNLKIYLQNKKKQSAMTYIVLKDLEEFEIPVPSLETQEKIVKILDKFTNYVTELQAELQARNKQYEYYRDTLLSEEYLKKLSENTKLLESNYKLRSTTLGDIGKFTRGNGLQKKDFISKGKPVIHYGQIYTKFNFEADKTISFVNDDVFSKLKKANFNDILIATTSENIEDVGKCVVWLGNEEIGFSGDMYSYSTKENSKYIAYYFQTNKFQKQKEQKVTGTKLIRIHGDDMAKFSITLPPRVIQNKVVEVLDKFQDLLSDTQGLLPEEIEQRQKQYEYYREKLLTFEDKSDSTPHAARRKITLRSYYAVLKQACDIVGIRFIYNVSDFLLKDITYYSKEKVNVSDLNNSNYVGVDNLLKDKCGKVDSSYLPPEGKVNIFRENDVLLGNIRPYLRKIWLSDRFGGANGDVLIFVIKDDWKNNILPKYLYQVLSSEKFFDYNINFSKGAKMPRGDKKKIMEYRILVPPMEVQDYVVSILDKFDKLVNDINEGLPKEIELRQKQYEYYRNKLLDFKSIN